MNACVTVEHRFERTPDGAVWTRSNHSYEESRRYLDVFESVRILARVRDVGVAPPPRLRADGDRVLFAPLPYYVGFEQFCLKWRSVRRTALRAIGDSDAIILKAPSTISSLIESAVRKKNRPFGVEVIGDPWGFYSKGSVRHPLRPLFRSVFTGRTRNQCQHACAVRYVSKHLQTKYPSNPVVFNVSVSDVYVPATTLARAPRYAVCAPVPLRLITVGSLELPCKGIDVLLRALRLCFDQDFACRLVVVGDGRRRPGLQALAARLGVDRMVDFRGMLPAGESVLAALDECDVFVMPSRQEGMPRAMIEAMARVLPCIGSSVGGIPELLDPKDLVPPDNPAELAAKIMEVGRSTYRMECMSKRCLERARDFQEPRLSGRVNSFLAHVRDATERWAATRSRNRTMAEVGARS